MTEPVDLERLIAEIEEWRKWRGADVSSPTRRLMMRCYAFLIETRAAHDAAIAADQEGKP